MRMKIFGLVTTMVLLFANSLFADMPLTDGEKILNKIQAIEFVKKAGFVIKKVKKVDNIYAVKATHPRMRNAELFVSIDFKTVIIGAGFKADGEKIEFLTNMKQYKDSAVYSVGNGSKNYYMFTDPECPYCQTFEKQIDNLKDDVKLYVFLFPLSFHEHAISMSKYVLSKNTSKERAEAMKSIANGSDEYSKAKYSDDDTKKYMKKIEENTNLGLDLGVQGTPTVYTEDGHSINWDTLLKSKAK